MRIAFAEVAQETDSFSPMIAELSDFEAFGLYFGEEILERMRGVGPIGGFLEVAAEQPAPVTLLPLVRAWGGAGGTISDRTLAVLRERLLAGLRAALPVDGVYLALHGAAAAASEDDVEGLLLADVRQLVGPEVPIAVCLDHHANVTQRMVTHADVLIGHETQPHDPVATGRKTARVLFAMLRGESRPTIAWQKIPMVTPQDQFLTSQGPMKEWFDQAREMERRPGVIDVSPYPMQPWLDVAEGGWAVVVHTESDQSLAATLAAESAALAWHLRDRFWKSDRVAPDEAVRRAAQMTSGLLILSDTGDSVYGGAPGDSTCILAELLAQRIPRRTLVPLVDGSAVAAALAAGVGAELALELGGKVDCLFSRPVPVSVRVAAVSRGVTVELPERGACDIGRSALLEIGEVRVVVLEERTFAINHPVVYTHLGIDLQDVRVVVLKTASNFQFFSPWRTGLIRVDAPGMTQSDLTAFTWKRIPRPVYPLDSLDHWQPTGS